MKPIKFKEANTVFAKQQESYLPLPAYKRVGDAWGEINSCYHLSLMERLILLFTGRVWLSVLTFEGKLQPQKLSITKPTNLF